MELSLLLMKQILSMMLMGLAGFVSVKTKILKPSQGDAFSAFCIYVIAPCTIVNAFQVDYSQEKLYGLLLAIAAAVVIHILYIGLTRLLGDGLKMSPVERASLIYTNGGNLIIPLVTSLLGAEWVFYCSAFLVVQNAFKWTHGSLLMLKGVRLNMKALLLNPNMLATYLGIFLFLARVSLPGIVQTALSGMSATIGPVSMFMLGMVLAEVDFRKVFTKLRVYFVCFGRLLLYPLVTILLIRVSGVCSILPDAKQVLLITMLAACAPVAVHVMQYISLVGSHEDTITAGAINAMSVLFSAVTMPLMVMLYQLIC